MLTREEALAIYHAGAETVVRVLLEMDARIHALERQVQDLTVRLDASEQRVRHLEERLATRNSAAIVPHDRFGEINCVTRNPGIGEPGF